ncbi:MAG: hypothetical protein GY801_46970 [bacterium]|nr:hypothetical protein [bacterium]
MMTNVEKLAKLQELLQEYKENESVFAAPAAETEQQKNFRENLRMVVALLFKEEADIPAGLSITELKDRIRKTWEDTRPDAWK